VTEIKVNAVTARYLGEDRAEITSRHRLFQVGQRMPDGPPEEQFCPLEMVIAGFAS
jgi:hypothetical protein